MAAHKFQSGEASGTPSTKAFARSGISFAPVWQNAIDEVIADVKTDKTGAPDLIVVFISSMWSDVYQEIIDRVRAETGCRSLIGSSSSGVIAGECCHESAPGITMMAMWLPGATLSPVYLDGVPTEWPWGQTVSQLDVRGIILFSDPYHTDAQKALESLRATTGSIPMIGALASTSLTDRRAWVYLDDQVYDHGAVAIAIEGPYDLVVQVSQGGTPIGDPWTVTEVDHNRIVSISNRSAISVLRETMNVGPHVQVPHNQLMVGFPMSEYRDEFFREDFVARGILAQDLEAGALVVGGIPRQGQTIQFLVREPTMASEDLSEKLELVKQIDRPVVGALLSTCKGRGANMFGRNDHDAQAVAKSLPDVPMIGLYSLGELGPVRDIPAYNAFAVSLGLIVER